MEQVPNGKLEAILWDFGGVFTTSPFENFNLLEERCGAPRDFIRTLNSVNPTTNAWAQFESNQVSLEEFDELFAKESKLAGHEIRGKEVISMLSGDLRPKMVELLKLCKEQYKVACITNNVKAGRGPGMSSDDDKASKVSKVMALFDDVIESSVEGIRKPKIEPRNIIKPTLGKTGLFRLIALSITLIEGLTTAKLIEASSLFCNKSKNKDSFTVSSLSIDLKIFSNSGMFL